MNSFVRVMSWNIHGGIGRDGRYDLGRTIARIKAFDPDIAAFQEVDTRGRAGGPSDFDLLAKAAGGHQVEARTITAPDGDYGHMLVSRWPIERATLHDLSFGRREPRFAIEAVVAHPRTPIHVVAVHLGLGWWERRRQAQRLTAVARRWPELTLMLGDFNDWTPLGLVRQRLAAAFPDRSRSVTFPACWPLLRLDRIYARPPGALHAAWADHGAAAASDHLPVLAAIDADALQPASAPRAAAAVVPAGTADRAGR